MVKGHLQRRVIVFQKLTSASLPQPPFNIFHHCLQGTSDQIIVYYTYLRIKAIAHNQFTNERVYQKHAY